MQIQYGFSKVRVSRQRATHSTLIYQNKTQHPTESQPSNVDETISSWFPHWQQHVGDAERIFSPQQLYSILHKISQERAKE
jgi:hypothetical protein